MLLSFFFNDTATTEIYTLSLHDALRSALKRRIDDGERGVRIGAEPFAVGPQRGRRGAEMAIGQVRVLRLQQRPHGHRRQDRKSTRLNSSHSQISYAVFCLKKKTNKKNT